MRSARNKSRSQPSLSQTPALTGGTSCWPVAGVCLALAAITLAVFGQTWHHDFVNYDDADYVSDNYVVCRGLTVQGLVWAFAGAHYYNWHPLTWLSHMLDCQLYGLNPGGHHLTSVLIHLSTVISLFLVLRQMTGALWRSAFVAAVFAIHPLRVESVAWVAERKDVLSGLFFVLTLGAYIRYARRPGSWVRYGLVAFLYALGLMCKPMLVTLPLVLLLLDFWPLRRKESAGKLVFEKLPLLALSAASALVTILAQKQVEQWGGTFALPSRLANALVTCIIYLRQMVYPAGLAVFYPYRDNGLPAGEVALAGLLMISLSVVAFWQRRKQPWLLVGWLWYLVMLLPVVGIIQVGEQAHADRYTYLPQIGLYTAITWLASEWLANQLAGRVFLGTLMAGIIAALAVCAMKQTAFWKDSGTLWTHAIACTGSNDVDHNNLGIFLQKKGRLNEALAQFQIAQACKPSLPQTHINLGNVYSDQGKVDDAIAQYQTALTMKPDYAEGYNNLGSVIEQTGKLDEAMALYQKALKFKPDFAQARNNLGNRFAAQGRLDEAVAQYQLALNLKPDFAESHNNYGKVLERTGKVNEAIAHYEMALKLKPDFAQAHNNLGDAFADQGRMDEAMAQYKIVLATKPDSAETHFDLGVALAHNGRLEEAIAQYREALKIIPEFAEAHNSLGIALGQKGRKEESIAEFQRAVQINPKYAEAHNNLGNALLDAGRADQAILQYKQALQIRPGDGIAHINLGIAFQKSGRVADAISEYQKALAILPGQQEAQTDLAWLLATSQDDSLRKGSNAVLLARQANAQSGGEDPMVLHTLAAALGEVGQFAEAIKNAQKAIELARAQGRTDWAARFQGELKCYQAGRAFRQK